METRAHLRAVHPAVAGQEAAALAEREAVDGVVTEELLPAGRHQGHAPARLVLVRAGHVPHVGHGEGGEGPLQGAVTQQGVSRHQEHIRTTCTIITLVKKFMQFSLNGFT